MKALFLIICLFFNTIVFSQNYIEYYQAINAAKSAVINEDFQIAAQKYQQTFEQFDFEFARDCYHAVEVAAILNVDSTTFFFIECALKRGIPFSFFEKMPELEAFRQTTYWQKIQDNQFQYFEIYKSQIDTTIRNEINRMFHNEQEIRAQYYKWYNFYKRTWLNKKWKILNHHQVMRIIEITNQKGFPGEQIIGIDEKSFHPKVEENRLSAGMPIVIFIHHYSQPNRSFDSLLIQEIKKGNLYPQHFAVICDFEAKYGQSKYPNFGFYGAAFPIKSDESAINEKRKSIGLLPIESVEKLSKSKVLTRFWKYLY